MSNHQRERKETELSAEALEAEEGMELLGREAMSMLNANIALPINAAVAANVLADNAVAYADADQYVPLEQET